MKNLKLTLSIAATFITYCLFAQVCKVDSAFGTNGIVTTAFDSGGVISQALVQPDGKIVVGGTYGNSIGHFALARYNADGSPDNTFGTGGIVTTSIGTIYDNLSGIALQTDLKIVAAGWTEIATGKNNFVVARYNSDGSLDNTFGAGGFTSTAIDTGDNRADAVIIQPDGKIILCGTYETFDTGFYDFALVRYNSNGSLDSTFGANGKVGTPVGTRYDEAYNMVLQSNGKIIAAGWANTNGYKFGIVRYQINGSLDSTFGNNGKAITIVNGGVDWVSLQADNKIVAAGEAYPVAAIARYNPDGTLDSTFNGNGINVFAFNGGTFEINSGIIQGDGKIVVLGAERTGIKNFELGRLTANGTIDSTFGINGLVSTPVDSGSDYGSSMIAISNEAIVAVGSASNDTNNLFALVEYSLNLACSGSPVISGDTIPIHSSSETYSVASQAGYTYNWTATGGTLASGQGTDSTTIQWGGVGSGWVSLIWYYGNANTCFSTDTLGVNIEYGLGITDVLSKGFNISPNPATDKLFVTLNEPTTLFISNIVGETILQREIETSGSLDISTLSPGVYFIYNRQRTEVAKFIKE